MNELKFKLSVVFTKTDLSPLSPNNLIIDKIKEIFGEEVLDEEVNVEIGEIIDDQVRYNNGFIVEIPEDFNLNDI